MELPGVSGVSASGDGAGVTWIVNGWLLVVAFSGSPGILIRTTVVPTLKNVCAIEYVELALTVPTSITWKSVPARFSRSR